MSTPEELRRVFERAALHALEVGRTQWLVWTQPWSEVDPLEWFAAQPAEERFFWQWREGGEAIAAHGVACEIEASGPERFEVVGERIAALRADIVHFDSPDREASEGDSQPPSDCLADSHLDSPLWLGGFGYEDEASNDPAWKAFPPARWVLPELSLTVMNSHCRLRIVRRVDAGADPARAADAATKALRVAVERFARYDRSGAALSTEVDRLTRSADGDKDEVAPPAAWGPGPSYRVQADRSHAEYRAQVEDAVDAIAAGGLEKVVLARSLSVVHDGDFGLTSFLDRISRAYPSCVVLAVGRGDDVLVAATPEPLVTVRGADVRAAALAGSAPRGQTPEQDVAFGRGLLESAKERAEHAIVVREILAALTDCCSDCVAPETPGLRRIEGVQHLETSIRAKLMPRSGASAGGIFGLAARLHPTPAVGGTPKAAAADWIRRREGLVRGWYAGPVGWADGEGGGHLRVALRSALIRSGRGIDGISSCARLFAGAGIVEGSSSKAELDETRIKLRALLAPLTEI